MPGVSLPTFGVNGFEPGVDTGEAATSLWPLTPAAADVVPPPPQDARRAAQARSAGSETIAPARGAR
jgi:hypothetical protein